jgi:hypothetical protein
MPDDPQVAVPAESQTPPAAGQQPSAASTPQTAAPASTPPSAPASVEAAFNAATTQQPAAPVTQPSWRDHFKGAGINLPEDDAQASQLLLQQVRDAQTLRQYAPYLHDFQQNYSDYANWKRQQQGQQAQPQSQEGPWFKQYWNPPEWNPAWEKMVTRDEQGHISPIPGQLVPPDVPGKVAQYLAWRQEQTSKFAENPFQFMEPAIRSIAAEMAQQQVQQHLSQYQEVQSSHQFVAQNAPWLYEQDQAGQIKHQPVFDPASGRYVQQRVLSPWGQKFRDYIVQESEWQRRHGINDTEAQTRRAMEKVQFEYLLAAQQTGAAPQQQQPQQAAPQQTPRQQANQSFLGRQTVQPVQRGPSSPASTPVTTRHELEQTLLQRFKEAGAI